MLVRCTWKMYCEGERDRATGEVGPPGCPCHRDPRVRSRGSGPVTVRAYLTSGSDTREFNGFISLPIISLVFSTCLVLHIFEFDVPRALGECGLAD